MAWEEWEQLKAAAAERQAGHMQLNQLQGPGVGSGSGHAAVEGTKDLKSNKAAWRRAGHDTGQLREGLGKALTRLKEGQHDVGPASGCLTLGAQHDVFATWARYAKAVDKRCGALADILEKTGNDLLKTDDAVKAEIDRLKAEYRDTPAVGGSDQGR